MAKTVYYRNALLSWAKGAAFINPPSALYVGLFTTPPTDVYTNSSPTGTEVVGGNYARQPVAFGPIVSIPGTGSSISNSSAITFPAATANWGAIVDIGIFDVSGNLLLFGFPQSNVSVPNGYQLVINIGSLIYSES